MRPELVDAILEAIEAAKLPLQAQIDALAARVAALEAGGGEDVRRRAEALADKLRGTAST